MPSPAPPPRRHAATAGRFLTALLVLVLLAGACGGSDDEGDASGDARERTTTTAAAAEGPSGAPDIATAIERSAGYFEALPPRGDVGFLLGQGSMNLSPEFQQWSDQLEPDPAVTAAMGDPSALQYLEAILWLQRNRAPHPWPTLAVPSVEPGSAETELDDDELAGVQEVMGSGLRCDQLDPEQRQAWLAGLATPSHSYLVTHQLLSLVWARVSGCLSDAEAEPLRVALASKVYAELETDGTTVNDLSLERMAMLCYAGLCDWVSDEQRDAVLAAQHSDGSWGDGSVPIHPDAFVPPAHTAGLGFYVLAMKWDPATPAPTPPA